MTVMIYTPVDSVDFFPKCLAQTQLPTRHLYMDMTKRFLNSKSLKPVFCSFPNTIGTSQLPLRQ